MAYDRFESRRGWRDPQSRFRREDSDRFESRSFGWDRDDDRTDRGFFERAGDEVASWFGDEEAERRRREEELWELALVDELTGLHNRRSFILLAEHAIKEAARAQRPVMGLFVDADRFKIINDTHGHSEGDRALRLVASALRGAWSRYRDGAPHERCPDNRRTLC